MCQLYSELNEQMEPTDDKPSGPNIEEHVGSSISNTVSSEQGTLKQDDSGHQDAPLVSPTISLSSSDSFASTSSDYSVDLNLRDGYSPQKGGFESGQEDSRYWLLNGHLTESSVVNLVNAHEQSDYPKENSEGEDKSVLGNPDFTRTSVRHDGKDDDSASDDESLDEENEPSLTFDDKDEIWDPPDAENEDDNKENSMASLDDDYDDECADGDGSEWGKPSSLNSLGSHRFKEEKEKAMEEVMNGKFQNLVSQLLKKLGVDNCDKKGESWVDILTPLAWQAASFVKPATTEGKAMDPAGYVKIKCIATGSRTESQLIKGLVFKKNAAHKHMSTKYKNPRLLLIQGMLDQSSGSSGLSSFSSMISGEKDNLVDLIEHLEACHPNVILVEKSASRDVLEKVLKMGVTLVVDMKLHRLERVARCTGSPILSSAVTLNQKLKHCDSLYFQKFVEEHANVGEGGKKPCKTLMFLDGCPTRLGCTILLKGSNSEELKKIKCVVQCAVVMAYHFILETSFLVDQKAMFSTIASGRATDISSSDEQSISLETETSSNRFNGEPNISVASADEVQVLISDGRDDDSSHVVESTVKPTEIASNGFHDKVSHNMLSVVDSPSTVIREPQTTLPRASPSVADALKIVSIVSTDIDSNGREPEVPTINSTPVSPSEEAPDRRDIEAKDSSEEGPLHNDSQPSSALPAAAVVVDDGQDCPQLKDEISSVLDSESILVLMSSRNASRGTICEQSHFSHIKFYRNFDVPLGKFLQDSLFSQRPQCKICGELPEAHIYYYAHHNKQLTIRVKQLRDKRRLPGESEGKLWMWSRCGKCESGKQKTTKRVLISTAARGLSFGKFLELSFSSNSSFNRLSSCGHSFRKDFLYFFGLGSMAAMFRYSRVATYTVSVPAQKLEFNSSINRDWLQHEIESVYTKGLLLFTEVANYLKKVESWFSGQNLVLNGSSKRFADIIDMLKSERSEFEESIKNIGIKHELSDNSIHELLSLNRLRWQILLEACIWDRRFQLLLSSSSTMPHITATDEAVRKQRDSEDRGSGGETEGSSTAAEKVVEGTTVLEDHSSRGEVDRTQETADEAMQGQMDMEKDHTEGTVTSEDTGVGEVEGTLKAVDSHHQDEIIEGEEIILHSDERSTSGNYTDVQAETETVAGADKLSFKELQGDQVLQGGEDIDVISSPIIEDTRVPTSEDSVPSVSLSEESSGSKKFSSRPHSINHGSHNDQISLSSDLSEDRSVPIVTDREDGSSTADKDAPEQLPSLSLSNSENSRGWVWNPFAQITEECMRDLQLGCHPKFGYLPKFELLHSPDLLPTVSQVIIEEGSRLHIPLSDGDHIVSDYDGEISSAIACALALMKDLFPPAFDGDENITLKRAVSEPSPHWSLSSPYDQDLLLSSTSMSFTESRFSSFDGLNLSDSLVSHRQVHPEVTLGMEKYPMKGKYTIITMYASEFRALRNRCCPSELDYIASLSRCKIWDAKGGKSKSFFAKTLDDRLIIKEIKKTEFESFVKFSPDYFRYMKQSFDSGNQTCLAKILGIYQVTIRHTKSGKETKHDLMVQENLSFGRSITRQYDLKGALHARFTATGDGTGDVLLDQNFVIDMNSSPLYVGQKAKRLLQRAVWNDTTFLNSVNVMDYSLLVGVDRQRRELICGIIDYLRQYTWDKQLETWVKSSLVVPKNVLPTIISPKEYKKRFRKFMDTHFLTVPDHWCSQRSSNPCKLCGIKGDDSSLVKSEKREEEQNSLNGP